MGRWLCSSENCLLVFYCPLCWYLVRKCLSSARLGASRPVLRVPARERTTGSVLLTVSRLFAVVTCPVDASSLSLLWPSKQVTTHFTSTTSARRDPLFLSYHHHLHLCLCPCTVLVFPTLSSTFYSLLELCICPVQSVRVHIPTIRLASRLWRQVFRRLSSSPHAFILSFHPLSKTRLASFQRIGSPSKKRFLSFRSVVFYAYHHTIAVRFRSFDRLIAFSVTLQASQIIIIVILFAAPRLLQLCTFKRHQIYLPGLSLSFSRLYYIHLGPSFSLHHYCYSHLTVQGLLYFLHFTFSPVTTIFSLLIIMAGLSSKIASPSPSAFSAPSLCVSLPQSQGECLLIIQT